MIRASAREMNAAGGPRSPLVEARSTGPFVLLRYADGAVTRSIVLVVPFTDRRYSLQLVLARSGGGR